MTIGCLEKENRDFLVVKGVQNMPQRRQDSIEPKLFENEQLYKEALSQFSLSS